MSSLGTNARTRYLTVLDFSNLGLPSRNSNEGEHVGLVIWIIEVLLVENSKQFFGRKFRLILCFIAVFLWFSGLGI